MMGQDGKPSIEYRVCLLEDWRKKQNSSIEKLIEKHEELAKNVAALSVKIDSIDERLKDAVIQASRSSALWNKWLQIAVSALTTGVVLLLIELIRLK